MKTYKLFIDESGDHGLTNINDEFPVFVLCGLLIDEDNYEIINQEVNFIKKTFWAGKKVIFHSRDIRKCEKEFAVFFDLDKKRDFYTSINNLFSSQDYTIIASAINKNEYISKHGKLGNDVYEIALSFIFERSLKVLFDSYSDKFQLQIFIERRGKKEDQKLSEHFQRLMSRGTTSFDYEFLKKHVSDIEFKHKKEDINGLQLSDLAAYPIARYVIDKERANPAFDILKEKFYEWQKEDCSLIIYP